MQAHRFRAPKDDGAILAEPPLDRASAILQDNLARTQSWDYDFQGRRFSVLREKARADAFRAAQAYHELTGLEIPGSSVADGPVVVTGHQPELFHPGVWIKNFAVAGIAASTGAAGLNLIVDNDIPKGAYIRVPHPTSLGLRNRIVPFDDWAGEAPFEDQPIQDHDLFASFPTRVQNEVGSQVALPLVNHFWDHVLSGRADTMNVGRRFARARRLVEAEWGIHNWEVPLSHLCETDGFRWFACHLLAHLDRFQAVHHDALTRYRTLYHIRSHNHPVPELGRSSEWLEAPFWVWRQSAPRRRPLQVRQLSKSMELRIGGEPNPFATLPLGPDREACCAVEALRELPAQGIRLRTRALTTTMFARLLIGDLFVHGIGGAKYDELGDEVAQGFFGIAPPNFLTLSMTLQLGLPTTPATVNDLHSVDRRLRDLSWQPERFLADNKSAAEALAAKRGLISLQPATKAERSTRYRSLRKINESLTSLIASRIEPTRLERTSIVKSLRDNAVARSREYSLVLHDEHRLRAAMTRVVAVSGS